MRRRILALSLCLLAAGCATDSYYYQPAEQATASISGHPAARYTIPPGLDQGDVRVSTFGMTDVRLFEDDDEPVHTIHVRFIVTNERGTQDWTVDTRDIQVELAGSSRRSAPMFVNSNGDKVPVVTIPPGESRTIDLYYPLPARIEGAKDLPEFDLVWRVQTDDRLVAERTPFERREVEPPPASYAYGWGFGAYPYWWYDPYFYGGFYGRSVLIQSHTVPRPRVYYYGR